MKLSCPAFSSCILCYMLFCSFSKSSAMLLIHLLADSEVHFSLFAFDTFTYAQSMKNAAAGQKSVKKMECS